MTALPLLAALAWTAALIAGSGSLSPAAALLAGVGLLTISVVSVVGMTVTGGRWAHRLGLGSVAAGLVIAVIRPIDGFWATGLVASAVAGSVLFAPGVTSRIRKLPAAAGPPQAAVLVAVVLLTSPFLIGVALGGASDWPALVVGLGAPVAAFAYARVIPGGLISIRLAWPALAIALAPLLDLPAAGMSVALAAVVAVIAWRPEVKTSFHPPREAGTTYPIPPELAPEDVLDAAGIDDKGHRK